MGDLKRCESEPIYAEAVCEIVCIFFTEAYDSEASYRLVPRLVKDGFIPALTQLCDGKLTLCAEEHCRTAMNCLNPTLRLLAVQPVYSSESPQHLTDRFRSFIHELQRHPDIVQVT